MEFLRKATSRCVVRDFNSGPSCCCQPLIGVPYLRLGPCRDDTPDWEPIAADHPMGRAVRGGLLRITTHVHEHAVAAGLPTLIHVDARLLVVSKPAGIACIGGGQQLTPSHSNVLDMLPRLWPELLDATATGAGAARAAEAPRAQKLVPAHRLDKPVSGVWWVDESMLALVSPRLCRALHCRVCTEGLIGRGLPHLALLVDDRILARSSGVQKKLMECISAPASHLPSAFRCVTTVQTAAFHSLTPLCYTRRGRGSGTLPG